MRRRWTTLVLATAMAGLSLPGCSFGQPSTPASTATSTPTPRVAFVALGSEATAGVGLDDPLHDLWAQRLFHTVLPPQTVFVNLATPGATASEARRDQLPPALELDPTIAVVWLTGDLSIGTSDDAYAADLTEVIQRLQGSGAEVLLAQGAPHDPVAARVAAATGATVVDLKGIVVDGAGLPLDQAAVAEGFAPAVTNVLAG